MNVENYREYLERIGHHVVADGDGYWFDAGPYFYEYTPPFALINPSKEQLDALFHTHQALGAKFCTDNQQIGKPSFYYACTDKAYDFPSIQTRTRGLIRKGLRAGNIRRIDFTYLYEHGLPLNRDTLARQHREDATFLDAKEWKRFCHAGQVVEGAVAWGAFVNNELAAYMMAFLIDGFALYLHQMSRTKYLDARVNHALTFVATKEMLAMPEVHCVSHGHESVRNLPGLDDYKVKMGYQKLAIRQVVKLRPMVKQVTMNPVSSFALNRLYRWLPDNDFLIRTRGILEIARYGA